MKPRRRYLVLCKHCRTRMFVRKSSLGYHVGWCMNKECPECSVTYEVKGDLGEKKENQPQ